MCDPVTIGIATLAMTAAGTVYTTTEAAKAADKKEKIEKDKLAAQEKAVAEATPTAVESQTTATDQAKNTIRLRRGIAQSIYSQSLSTAKKMGE
jgi:uncharacterized iron-regulated protein